MCDEAIRGLVISPMVRRFSEKAAVEHTENIPIQAANAVVTTKIDVEVKENHERVEWLTWLNSTIGLG